MSDLTNNHTEKSKTSDRTQSAPSSIALYDQSALAPTTTRQSDVYQLGFLKFRPYDDNDEQDWWFASIVCPLLAATLGPFANVLSIAAYVVSWRMDLVDETGAAIDISQQLMGTPFPDPHWALKINIASLVLGYVGNMFLLANFTNRIRYIAALPVTILCWTLSAGMLIGIVVGMAIYAAPQEGQIYTQGYWYGVLAAILYTVCLALCSVNMLGYFLGHYPQHFNLTDSQRTLILQTMLYFIWLAGGAGIFQAIQNRYSPTQHWLFTDAIYYADVTILTVGFGDVVPTIDQSRGFLIPYAIGGIIMLGLMVASISTFAAEISKENVLKKRVDSQRVRTLERSTQKPAGFELSGTGLFTHPMPLVNSSRPLDDRRRSSTISRRAAKLRNASATNETSLAFETPEKPKNSADGVKNNPYPQSKDEKSRPILRTIQRTGTFLLSQAPGALPRRRTRKPRALLLREEKDRFLAMRSIESSIKRWKGWTALVFSVTAFLILWCCGSAVFLVTERDTIGLSYFDAMYFCYVSLLTIGYGDFAPKSQAGRPVFVVWSLLAVPTMTILVSNMSGTVIHYFDKGTNTLADFTVLPKYGIWRDFVQRHQWLQCLDIEAQRDKRRARQRIARGFQIGAEMDAIQATDRRMSVIDDGEEIEVEMVPTLDELAEEDRPTSDSELGRKLAITIQRVALDTRTANEKKYAYEEWVEFTELIRFTSARRRRLNRLKQEGTLDDDQDKWGGQEQEEGLIEWDWIGEDSPMMQDQTEPEFVLERLCESMTRYTKHHVPKGGL